MIQLLNFLQPILPLHNSTSIYFNPPSYSLHKPKSLTYKGSLEKRNSTCNCSKAEANVCIAEAEHATPHVQTLGKFPKEVLFGKVIMVQCDTTLLLREAQDSSTPSSLLTIKYLNRAGAKVLIASHWGRLRDEVQIVSREILADHLSSVLELKVVPVNWISSCIQSKKEVLEEQDVLLIENLSEYREETANCSLFSRKLSSGVDILVNDCFSQTHKILASTVGVPRYCYASIAGFRFEEELLQVMEITKITKKPYIAIIGGGNLYDKAAALHVLASVSDGMFFVGMMAFQIMNALGLPVPSSFVDHSALEDSLKIIKHARERNMPVLFPKDFVCVNFRDEFKIFPADGILDGWSPIDLGPNSIDELTSLLSKCKKVLWIGPVKFKLSRPDSYETFKLARLLETFSRGGCDVTVVGSASCKAISTGSSSFLSHCCLIESASVTWEFLKGRTLPGLAALDRAYPFEINWNDIYYNAAQPLVVDIGSGNGLFLLGMARGEKALNFLGLETNKKLVKRCLDSVHLSGNKNGYFIATNATSTFRSIVSSYPGKLVLVSIQCPNPDFNKPDHRWRMLQKSLVEAIMDMLTIGGKVFLQSDVEAVAISMRDQFMLYGKGRLVITDNDGDFETDNGRWLKENPYGVRSDWELHVLGRGAPMYRLMISKVDQS